MNKDPQTIDDLLELITRRDFKPTCEQFSKMIDKVLANEENKPEKTKERVKKR